QLGVVHGKDCSHRFEFDHYEIVDDQVDLVAAIEHDIPVHQRQLDLHVDLEASFTQLEGETGEVHRFEQSRSERTVDLHGALDDRPRQSIDFRVLAHGLDDDASPCHREDQRLAGKVRGY